MRVLLDTSLDSSSTPLLISLVIGALMTITTAVIAPLAIVHAQAKIRKQEREADWERQDEVAARLLAAQQEATRRTEEVAKVAREGQARTDEQLSQIHTLVDGNLTAEMEQHLYALANQQATLKEVVRLNDAAGHPPNQDTLDAIVETAAKIEDLRAKIRDRHEAVAENAAAIAKADGA